MCTALFAVGQWSLDDGGRWPARVQQGILSPVVGSGLQGGSQEDTRRRLAGGCSVAASRRLAVAFSVCGDDAQEAEHCESKVRRMRAPLRPQNRPGAPLTVHRAS